MTNDKTLQLAWRTLRRLVPHHARERARELAERYQYDDEFREYVASRTWLVLPTGFVFVLVSTVCAIGTVIFIGRYIRPPAPFLGFAVLLLGIAVWLAGIAAQLLVYFSWLEHRALPHLVPPARREARRASFDRRSAAALLRDILSRISARSLSLWIPVAVFVLVPLGMLAFTSPKAVVFLVGIGILAPVLYIFFDR
jgi:hypothetical protein